MPRLVDFSKCFFLCRSRRHYNRLWRHLSCYDRWKSILYVLRFDKVVELKFQILRISVFLFSIFCLEKSARAYMFSCYPEMPVAKYLSAKRYDKIHTIFKRNLDQTCWNIHSIRLIRNHSHTSLRLYAARRSHFYRRCVFCGHITDYCSYGIY